MDPLHSVTLGDVLREHRRRFPNFTAVVDGDRRYTYPELDERVTRLTNALVQHGVGAGDRVLWLGQNSHRVIELLLAAGRIGSVFCPANWRQSPQELAFVIDDFDAGVVVWQEQEVGESVRRGRELASASRALWVQHDSEGSDGYEALLASGGTRDDEREVDPASSLLALYTAGFSGRPAAALLSHLALLHSGVLNAYLFDIDSTTVFLNVGPMFHMGVYLQLIPTFLFGGTNVVSRRVEPEVLCRLIDAERCTRALPLVPATMESMLEVNAYGRYDLSSLISGPGPENWQDHVRPDRSRAAAIAANWGQTEVSGPVSWAAYGVVGKGLHGRSSPLAMVRIVDEDGNELPPGEVGELMVRGSVVANGYFNRDELNAIQFGQGWRRTSDLARRESDGSITFIGPKTQMIKSGVENIYPAEVEACLRRHSAVADAAIIGVPDPQWVQAVKAIVVLKDSATATADELIEHCRHEIASYKKPRSVEFVDAIPRRGFLVDYKTLDERFGGGGYPGGTTRST